MDSVPIDAVKRVVRLPGPPCIHFQDYARSRRCGSRLDVVSMNDGYGMSQSKVPRVLLGQLT